MMLTKYNTKHAFLSEARSPHTLNLLLNLISENILSRSDIVLILYGDISSEKSILHKARLYSIETLTWDEIKESNLQFLSFNPFSLSSFNSKIINECIRKGFVKSSCINFLMQDDEIDRWNKIYNKYGKLVEDESAFVDSDVISILNTVDSYIVPRQPWGDILERVVGRKLKIVDAIIPFSVIDYQSEKIFDQFLNSRRINKIKDNTYKILFYTKPTTLKEVLDSLSAVMHVILKSKTPLQGKSITIGLWMSPSYKINLLQKALKTLASKQMVNNINIEFKKNMTHEQYLFMLHDYDCLILQERGGFSTAKYFAEKIGKLVTLTDSLNDKALQLDYGIKTFNYKSPKDALVAAISSANIDETIEIRSFSDIMSQRHNESYLILKDFWGNF